MALYPTPPHIVVVAIDTLRPSHLGLYGYARDTAPALDALADECVVFDAAFAAGIPTMPSFTTLYTGLHPYRHGIVAHNGRRRLDAAIRLLPQLAQARGYRTVACDSLVTQGHGRGSWFARGYDQYAGYLYRPFSDQSTWITDQALEFVQDYGDPRGDPPLFMFLHYWDPHSPYGPLPPYDTLHYTPGSGPMEMATVRAIAPEYYDAFLTDMRLRHPDDYAYIVAQYDGEISQVDAQVGRLIASLKAQGLWDNAIVVVLSDHGEAFGEGGLYFDHHGLYDAVTRIALLMHLPGQAGRRIRALVSTEDLLPTLSELADLPTPPYQLTGTSLVPLVNGSTSVRDRVVLAESSRQASLALRTTRWKAIQPIVADAAGRPIPDLYGRPRRPAPLLFDLEHDPGEQHDLSRERPDVLAALLDELEQWRRDSAAATGEPDPILTQGLGLPYDFFMERLTNRR